MNTSNAYCKALGIQVPRLEVARHSPDANYYSLLIVALLERGEPLTLQEAAKRLEEAGVAPADRALASLKRCRPARPPLYRDGDLYALDPHDHEADLWAFRLGLRPPKGASAQGRSAGPSSAAIARRGTDGPSPRRGVARRDSERLVGPAGRDLRARRPWNRDAPG